jgi:hypothetical protein
VPTANALWRSGLTLLLHVLPQDFHRIRHYGLLGSADRKANVARDRALFAVP